MAKDSDRLADHRDPARVREVYEEIASHFSKTRAYPWPEVAAFLDDVPGGDRGLDIGAGNGRHAETLGTVVEEVVALDVSHALLEEARAKMAADGWEAALVQGDGARLPLVSGSVDVGLYVATLHHLPDRETRVESLRELSRVLTGNGCALVSAWSTAHDRFDAEEGFDTTIEWTLPGGETRERFYHIYDPAEFKRDIEQSGLVLDDFELSSGNCYARVSPEE